jgi:DNA-directed RNA polymerase subunit RPC12/RpoP
MKLDLQLDTWASSAPWLAAPVVIAAGLLWVWWVRHALDHRLKVHCQDCHYRGHPRLKIGPARARARVCPDCGSNHLTRVRPRDWLHHQEATPLAAALRQVSHRDPDQAQA